MLLLPTKATTAAAIARRRQNHRRQNRYHVHLPRPAEDKKIWKMVCAMAVMSKKKIPAPIIKLVIKPAPLTKPATVPATAAVEALKRFPTISEPITPAIKINKAAAQGFFTCLLLLQRLFLTLFPILAQPVRQLQGLGLKSVRFLPSLHLCLVHIGLV